MDRYYELENLRRSIVMLPPGSQAMAREDAIALISELQGTIRRLQSLHRGLRQLLTTEET